MSNDLLDPVDLDHLPGAPFVEREVDEAVAALRGELGWHVAPSYPVAPETVETVVVNSRGGSVIYLPTRYLTSVVEVRDMTGDTPVILTDWRASVSGRIELDYGWGWPRGLGAIEVDIIHGYSKCPPELRPIIARQVVRSRSNAGQIVAESGDDFSFKYSDEDASADDRLDQTLARFVAWTASPAAAA